MKTKKEAREVLRKAKEQLQTGKLRFDPDYLEIKKRCKEILLDRFSLEG